MRDASDLVRAKAVLLDPGARQAPARPGGAAHRAGRPARLLAVLARRGDRADRPGRAGRGRRAGPPRAGAVLRSRPGAAARRPPDIDRLAEQLWYPLWNAGIGLDHSVRTPGQAVQVAATDLRAALGLLEARHIAGDAALSDTVPRRRPAGLAGRHPQPVRRARRRRPRPLGQGRRRRAPGRAGPEERPRRAARHPADRRARRWPSCSTGPAGDVQQARALLLDVPHRAAPARRPRPRRAARPGRRRGGRRAGDRRPVRAGPGAVRGRAGGRVRRRGGPALGARRAAPARAGRAAPPAGAPAAGPRVVVEHAGEVALARDAAAARDPALVLRVAATAARTGLPVAAGTLHRLADTAPELREPWPPSGAGRAAVAAGQPGAPMVDVVEALDRTGLWGRLFPEWGAVRDLPPRDRAHVWTVDRHLVEAAAHAGPADHPGGPPGPAAGRCPAARHRQGPRRRPLGGRGVAGRADRAPAGVRRAGRRAARRDGRATTCCCRTPRPAATSRTRPR